MAYQEEEMMKMKMKKAISAALTAAAMMLAAPLDGRAQEFPSGPITLVVPFPAGGNADTVARLVAEAASAPLGQPVVVDNRPGGHGMVAAAQVLGSRPDGHVLYLGTDGQYAINSSVLKAEDRDDPLDRMVPVVQLVNGPLVIAASPTSGLETFGQLIEAARGGKVFSYGANDVRSAHYIISRILQDEANIEMRHIPYGGTAEAMPDLLSGRIDLLIGQSTSLAPQQSQGVKLLAVTTAQRLADLPDVPPVADVLPEFDYSVAYGIFASRDTPPEVVERLNGAFVQALGAENVRAAIEASGAVPAPGTPEAFGRFVAAKREAFGKVVAGLNLGE